VAQQVTDQSADCVLALKANQGTLNGDVRLLPDDPAAPVAEFTQTNKGHGRVETRTAKVSDGVAWLREVHQWPGLKAVGQVTATRYQDGQTSTENRYHLLSEVFGPERFNEIAQSHWGIENELHRRLDAVFREGQARNRKGHCAENLALLRKVALNLARQEPSKGSMRGKLKRAGWDDTFLTTMLLQFANLPMR
jgi:predicted transposase YbfD/YdcC